MSLTIARGYIKRLVENNRVLRYLRENHGGLLTDFAAIAAAEEVRRLLE